ncbi:MAG: HAMP domain-containing protein [Deltaproteobacteria bacterium]|nr:HAMP domain-containing protein [Deltaproteobacteria bacterium]
MAPAISDPAGPARQVLPAPAGDPLPRWSGTARRLLLAFGALLAVFALAALLTLRGFQRVHDGLDTAREGAESVRLALELASAVRDQYAHQAHTIIIGDESHLGFYEAAQKRVLDLLPQVRSRAATPEELAWVDEIAGATGELDRVFRERIVPAVLRGERADVKLEHDRAQLLVTRIQDRTEQLVDGFEAAIARVQARVEASERGTVRGVLALQLASALLALGLGLWVLRSVARPIARLRAGAARLAGGDLDAHIAVDSPDEFGALAQQFNAMTRSLREHQEKLLQSEKLAGIGRLAAGVAHEINNPLGVILGYAKLLRKRADDGTAGDLRIIEEETLRCREIVEGLLDLSRPLPAHPQPVDLRELTDEVLARLREAKLLDGVTVTVEGSAVARGHAQKLRQVLFNLVRNGAEAAGTGGRVDVRLGSASGAAEVAVADSGRGISQEAAGRLFEPFFTTKDHGTGLGLAVSLAIARAHGGSIEAGAAPAGGACFTLRLPGLPGGIT